MFSADLRAAAAPIWEAQHAHPFVTGIGDGTLSPDRFAHWVRQDHLFLVGYARLLALGAARAPDLPTMRRFAELTSAILGEYAELAAALLPCMWGFSEVGERLEARGRPGHPHYDAWIGTYADPDFAALAGWCRTLVDDLAAGASPALRARMQEAFVTCSRHELAFWDMGWTLQRTEP